MSVALSSLDPRRNRHSSHEETRETGTQKEIAGMGEMHIESWWTRAGHDMGQ